MNDLSYRRSNSRVLVVEDDASVAALERRVLERHHHAVDVVDRAQTAIERLGSGQYAAVVLDYRLEDGDGWPVLDAARSCIPPVPVVLVTGAGDERVAAEAIRRGAAGYLVKAGQFSLALPEAIDRIVREASAEQFAALLARIVESADDPVLSTTQSGVIVSWNPSAARLFGRTALQAIGEPVESLLFFDDPQFLARVFGTAQPDAADAHQTTPCDEASADRGESSTAPCAATCVRPDGSLRELAVTISIVRSLRGAVSNVAFLARDVTEQNATERLLAQQVESLAAAQQALEIELHARKTAERRYRILFEHATVAVIVFREDLHIVEVNRLGEKLWGLPRDQIIGRPITDFHRPEFAQRVADRLASLFAGVKVGPAIFPMQRSDGGETLTEVDSTLIELDGERMVLSMGKDVTSQVAAEQALRASEARYASLLEHIPDLVWRTTPLGHPLFVSPAIEPITGFTAEEVYAGGSAIWPDRMHEDDADFVRASCAQLADGRPNDIKFRFRHKDGHHIWLRSRGLRVHLPDGTTIDEGLASDITETKRLEEQFLQAQRLEAVSLLTAGVAHDFNNLLSAILAGATFIAADLPVDHPSRADALDIKAAAESAARLTRQLLAFGRKQHMSPMVVEVNDVLTSMEHLLRRSISEDIVLQTELAPRLPDVLVDVGQLEQVVLNLVVNARDAMPKGGTLTLKTEFAGTAGVGALARQELNPGEYVCISVRDTGTGMDAATLARIFEPFFTTKEVGKGTGLGLSTCYGIAHQSGGGIEVDSQPGVGSTFRVYLPIAPGLLPSPEPPATPAPPAPSGPALILVVEDDPAVRKAVGRILRDRGCEVLTAANLTEAVAVCRAQAGRLDLVISDVVMAGGSGPQVLTALQAIQPGLCAILMSGYADHPALQGGQLPAGVHFLQKPFDPAVLMQLVCTVLSPRGCGQELPG